MNTNGCQQFIKAKRAESVRMKTKLLTTSLIVLYFSSCVQLDNKNQLTIRKDTIDNKLETKQSFPEYYFKINCPCKLKQKFVNEQDKYYAFRCNSTDKETIYAISVKSLKEDLREFYNHSSKEYYKSKFLEEYEIILKANKIEYKKPIIYGFNAIEYSVPIKNILNKQAIFVSSNLAYTLSVTSSADKNEDENSSCAP